MPENHGPLCCGQIVAGKGVNKNKNRQGKTLPGARDPGSPFLVKTAMAAAISLGCASAHADAVPRSNFRLTLDDEISSRIDAPALPTFDGRLAFEALIQSHPDPLFAELEKRYQALPPFTETLEDIPERYIIEASTPERMLASVKGTATDLSRFVHSIQSSVRYDDIDQENHRNSPDTNPDYSTLLAVVNPAFEYEANRRKWRIKARYDYQRGRYLSGDRSDVNDHMLNVNWTMRLNRGNELRLLTLMEKSHYRETQNPIQDFNSAQEFDDLSYDRTLVKLAYRDGTLRDRTRYELYLTHEQSDLNADAAFDGGYELNRVGLGGSYAWQMRKQLALVAEAKYEDFDYDLQYRDNNHFQALVGTDMIIGRRIRANLRVGYEHKEFSEALGDNSYGEPVWRGMMEWALRRRTTVKVETGRDIYELATVEHPIDTSKFNVQNWVKTAWKESWSDSLSTEASYTYRGVRSGDDNNDGDAHQFLLSAAYRVNARLRLALDGAYTTQKHDINGDLKRRTLTFRTDYSL